MKTTQAKSGNQPGDDAGALADPDSAQWSARLALALVGDLADSAVIALAKQLPALDSATPTTELRLLRRRIVDQSSRSPELRGALMRGWRESKPELLAEVIRELASCSDPSIATGALLQRFTARDILLEMITDPNDQGWTVAEEWVTALRADRLRSEFATVLREFADPSGLDESPAQKRIRVVIFGGHPRDESELAARIFPNGPFDIRWKASERLGVQVRHVVTSSLNFADGAIVVTCRVSHEVMHAVKRHCQIYNLPVEIVVKATQVQIKQALRTMFPGATGERPV